MDEYEPTEGCLRGKAFEMRIAAFGYEYSDATDPDDRQWVNGAVDLTLVTSFRFHVRAELTFRAHELMAFHEQMAALHKNLSGEAVLTHMEEEVELRVRLDNGKGTISGFVQSHPGVRLSFDDIPTDQSYLFDVVAGLERIVDAFPPR